jgi:hypothetical protein
MGNPPDGEPQIAGGQSGVTIAGRFEAALDEVDEPGLAGPELLPVRLARAAARTLRVDGAGLSLLDAAQQRVPLGASSTPAEVAERLQFTVGAGPCMTAHDTRQPVFAVEDELQHRWPAFADLLRGATPFRAVVALPLRPALTGNGAIDFYFERSEGVLALDVFEAMSVGELVSSALNDAAVWSTSSAANGPEWLTGPTPSRRAAVWEATGLRRVSRQSTNGRRARPASSRDVRTARAISTAPGVSPCTHTDWTGMSTGEPSTASTTPSAAIRSARAATVTGSWTRAPGWVRGTRVPAGV